MSPRQKTYWQNNKLTRNFFLANKRFYKQSFFPYNTNNTKSPWKIYTTWNIFVHPAYVENPSAVWEESRSRAEWESERGENRVRERERAAERRDGGETQLTCCCCRCSSSTVLTSLLVSPALDLPSLLPASNWLLLRVLIPFWLIELLLIVSVADSCIIMI